MQQTFLENRHPPQQHYKQKKKENKITCDHIFLDI